MSLEVSNRLRRVEQGVDALNERVLQAANALHALRDALAQMRDDIETNYARKRGPKGKANGDLETRPAD